MTLQYYLHRCGLAARRKVNAIIEQGRVAVNGTVVREFWLSVNPDKDGVTVDGTPCHLPLGHHYYLFHKPRGLITSVSDPRGRQTVIDYVRKVHGLSEPLHPTGRLDKDTEGLLILTDDGDFTQKITHPSHEIPKVYVAVLKNDIARTEAHPGIRNTDRRRDDGESKTGKSSSGKERFGRSTVLADHDTRREETTGTPNVRSGWHPGDVPAPRQNRVFYP
ncbi:MAG TPA: pseudouridine synthase [Thermotogota bacterium]|nr:pseudouridine synthase [Thermotogota bacterium]